MMPAMAGTLYLGTSGFGYDEWRHGVFYPEGLPASRMLSHYATLFRSVEINYTFRKFPSQKVLTAWLQQTPEGFRFTLKANQRITHVRRLRDVAGEVRAFMSEAAALGDRLGPVLFQVPPTVEYDQQLLAGFADGLPPGIASVMEFRHESWRAAWPFLAERGIARCVADTDDAAAREDELVWQPFGYLRLRRVSYSDSELSVWAERIQAALDGGGDVYCYFKHEDSAAGPRMALRLAHLMDSARVSRK
jgi:uncharacterized protein YecE (DUF72 family)